jgi:hypothetical protein
MFDWLFHWMHDGEVLKALIPAIGYVFVGAITWIGIWRTSKIAKQTLEDTREATPPELLRLEKWSTILKDSKDYPKEIRDGLKLKAIYTTYNDVLMRATLEDKVIKLGILSAEVRENLISIKPSSGGIYYPRPSWEKMVLKNWAISITLILGFLINFITLGFGVATGRTPFWLFIIFFVSFTFAGVMIFRAEKFNKTQKNIIFRNGYHALRNVYLARESISLVETPREIKEREGFEKTRAYKEWENKIKEEYPKWTSWNYGLDIGDNNKPDDYGDINPSKIQSIVLWIKSLFQKPTPENPDQEP